MAPRKPRRISGPARPAARPATRPSPARQPTRAPDRSLDGERGLLLGALAAIASVSRNPSLDRLIRGRTWIALIAFALLGIVTLQLLVLRLNVNIGRALVREAQLQRANAAPSIENSELAAGERVESLTAKLGMELVPEGALRFLSINPRPDIARAAGAPNKPVRDDERHIPKQRLEPVLRISAEAGEVASTSETSAGARYTATGAATSATAKASTASCRKPAPIRRNKAPARDDPRPCSSPQSPSRRRRTEGAAAMGTAVRRALSKRPGDLARPGPSGGAGRACACRPAPHRGDLALFFLLLVLAAGRTVSHRGPRSDAATIRRASSDTETVIVPRGSITMTDGRPGCVRAG